MVINPDATETFVFRWAVLMILMVVLNYITNDAGLTASEVGPLVFAMAALAAWVFVVWCRKSALTTPFRKGYGWMGAFYATLGVGAAGVSTSVSITTWVPLTALLAVYPLLFGAYEREFERYLDQSVVPWLERVTGESLEGNG